VIIYGVYMAWQPQDELINLFDSAEKANAYIDGKPHPKKYFVQEMQVY
jgi:hypothetical protein